MYAQVAELQAAKRVIGVKWFNISATAGARMAAHDPAAIEDNEVSSRVKLRVSKLQKHTKYLWGPQDRPGHVILFKHRHG